ncbi:MAG: MopE-related protein [Byssovorax sp.]
MTTTRPTRLPRRDARPTIATIATIAALSALCAAPWACTLSTAGIPGGAGGSGGGSPCKPGDTRSCFSGPAEKAGKGPCKAGTQTCGEDGAWSEECKGEVLPAAEETCNNALDDDCDGQVDGPSCGCVVGSIQACYTGDPATRDIGACKSGQQVCEAASMTWGACTGEIVPGPEDCASGLDQDCDGALTACTGDPISLLQSGTAMPAPDDDVGYAAAAGPEGTFVFGGVQKASLMLGGYDVISGNGLLIATGADGQVAWAKTFEPNAGGGHHVVFRGLAVDSDGAVVAVGEAAGHVDFGGGMLKSSSDSRDIAVLKLDKDGGYLISDLFGDGQTQTALSVSLDADHNIYMTGIANGNINFGGGVELKGAVADLFVAKMDKDGKPLWIKGFGDGLFQVGWSISARAKGKVIVAGDLAGTADFGVTKLTSAGASDVMVAALDAETGQALWAKRFGDAFDQVAYSVAVDSAGNIALVGSFRGSLDFGPTHLANADAVNTSRDIFAARLDPDGKPLWARRFGDVRDQDAESVAVDSGGNMTLTGSFVGTLAFDAQSLVNADPGQLNADLFVAKLRATDGGTLWAKRFGDAAEQRGWGVAVDPVHGNIGVTGGFRGTLDAGPPAGGAASAGDSDLFALLLAP